LRAHLATVRGEEPVQLTFNGSVLMFRCSAKVVAAIPAIGSPWNAEFTIAASKLQRLPKRFMHDEKENLREEPK
jgi:hypothetical protein